MSWIALPLPPTGNHMFMTVKRGKRQGGRVLSPEYREWRDGAVQIVALQARGNRIDGPYALHIRAGRPDRRKRDVDNLIKPVSDAIVKGTLVSDDSLCQRVTCEWVSGLAGIQILALPTTLVPL